MVGQLRGVQEGLGGDAAVVEAGAAELVLLHEPDGEAELNGPQRGGVAAAAATEYQDVEFCAVAYRPSPSCDVDLRHRTACRSRRGVAQAVGSATW